MSNVNLAIRCVYNFEVYPSSIIGSNFKNVTVLALMDKNTAQKEIDAAGMHVQVYPYLPPGTPTNPDGYDYVKIKTMSGQTAVLGLAWIKPETIELVMAKTVNVKIANVTASDVPRIRNALVQNGFNDLTIDII